MNSTDYKLEDKLLASSLKGVQGNNIFLAFYEVSFFLIQDSAGPGFLVNRVKCTNGKKVYTEEKQYCTLLFYFICSTIMKSDFYFLYP